MYNYTLSTILGFVAMAFAMSSYFFKKRTLFLTAQAGAILFLAFSCFFIEEYYALVSYALGLLRVGVYYLYERKNKSVPVIVIILFMVLFILSYLLINVIMLNTFKQLDIMLMIANLLFTLSFSIRNLKMLRYIISMPLLLTTIYYILIKATIFVIISYVFEFLASIVAIIINIDKVNIKLLEMINKGKRL